MGNHTSSTYFLNKFVSDIQFILFASPQVLSCTCHKITKQPVKTESNHHYFFHNGLLWMFLGSLLCTELSTLLPFSVWKIRPKPDEILTAHALLPHWMWIDIRQNRLKLKQFSFHFTDNVHSNSCLVWDPHSLVNPIAGFFECLFPYVYAHSEQAAWVRPSESVRHRATYLSFKKQIKLNESWSERDEYGDW